MKHVSKNRSVQIGITGHRILMDVAQVVRGVEQGIDAIRQAYPGRFLTILSSLAEGADRIAVEAVLRTPGARLTAVLPFDQEDYACDFGNEGAPSRLHFDALLARAAEIVRLPKQTIHERGYAEAGNYILQHSDVLLAVWDGLHAQGMGGTGEIVVQARALGKPLVIVRAGNRKPGTQEPTTLGAAQGQVMTERLRISNRNIS